MTRPLRSGGTTLWPQPDGSWVAERTAEAAPEPVQPTPERLAALTWERYFDPPPPPPRAVVAFPFPPIPEPKPDPPVWTGPEVEPEPEPDARAHRVYVAERAMSKLRARLRAMGEPPPRTPEPRPTTPPPYFPADPPWFQPQPYVRGRCRFTERLRRGFWIVSQEDPRPLLLAEVLPAPPRRAAL